MLGAAEVPLGRGTQSEALTSSCLSGYFCRKEELPDPGWEGPRVPVPTYWSSLPQLEQTRTNLSQGPRFARLPAGASEHKAMPGTQ